MLSNRKHKGSNFVDKDHPWEWDDPEINILLESANRSLGGLNSYADLIPNIDVYIRLHIKTEAHKSNKIEGTKTSMEEELMRLEDIVPEKRNDHISFLPLIIWYLI